MAPALIVLLFLTAVRANSGEVAYKAEGDTCFLTPGSTKPITHIMWKHGADIALQWDGEDTYTYRQFEGRSSLNTSTGELAIIGLTQDDSGNYTAEVNGQVTSTTQLQVISPVSKPSISTWCDPQMTYCILTCDGNTTAAEPITCSWQAGDKVLTSTNKLNITKDTKEPLFKCVLTNPVSSSESDAVPNPLSTRNRMFTLTLLVPLAVIVLVCILYCIYKRINGRESDGTAEEKSVMLQNVRRASPQDLTSVVSEGANKVVKKKSVKFQNGQRASPQDLTSVVSEGANNVAENSAVMPNGRETSGREPPADAQPAGVQAGDKQPAGLQAGDKQPADAQPAGVQAGDKQPADAQPAGVQAGDKQPADAQPANTLPVDDQPADAAPPANKEQS
ncbi:uncharacterized protein LOC121627554 [Chelmon rostratus]|uniref:uncharacterized protein LOC121627554 n=1 Tax=Chelmon rostratus TaxID=109905 RepID=UPI001BE6FFB7|nr:uncharacterized protein LOC121627554 [Chelmon rostratus]